MIIAQNTRLRRFPGFSRKGIRAVWEPSRVSRAGNVICTTWPYVPLTVVRRVA